MVIPQSDVEQESISLMKKMEFSGSERWKGKAKIKRKQLQ